MRKYVCKKGKSDFSPLDSSIVPVQSFKMDYIVKFEESCWYDISTIGDHWNKGGGFVKYFSKNDANNFLWVWRPSKELNKIEVTWYRNDAKGDHTFGQDQIITVDVNELVNISIYHYVTAIKYDAVYKDQKVMYDARLEKDYKLYRRLGLWFGGNPKCPQDMAIYVGMSKG